MNRYYINCFLSVGVLIASLGCRAEHGPPIESSWVTPPIPESEAGKVVAEYIKVFNSGDQTALSQFVRDVATEHGPGGASLEERIASQSYFYNQARGMDVYSVDQPKDDEVSLIARLRLKEQWRQMDFLFEGQPKKLAGIRIVPTEARAESIFTGKDWKAKLDQYLDRQSAVDQFSGVVLVVSDEKPLYAKAFGYADKSAGLPNTMQTKFNYASIGKMFTAVAIAQLVEKNLLSFEDSLNGLLPQFDSPSAIHITVGDLLTHQSGLPDFFEQIDHFKSAMASDNMLTEFLPVLARLPVNFLPRERFEYSNSNYMVLGAIIEQLSNQRYEDYIREHVFVPAGMVHTSFHTDAATAKGYTELGEDGKLTPGVRRENSFMGASKGSAAGGGVTTAGDLASFVKAMQNGKLVSQEMVANLLEPKVKGQRPDEQYGFGFIIRDEGKSNYVGHSGGFPGVDAQLDFRRKDGTVFVVLCNYEAVGEPVARYAESVLKQQP